MSVSFVKAQRKALLGRKIGMTQIYSDAGSVVPVTVLEVGPCTVLEVNPSKKSGLASLKLGFLDSRKKPPFPQMGLFRKVKTRPKKFIREVPLLGPEAISRIPIYSPKAGKIEYRELVEEKNLASLKLPGSPLWRRTVIVPSSAVETSKESPELESAETAAAALGSQDEAAAAEPRADKKADDSVAGPQEPLQPAILVKDESGQVLGEYPLPPGTSIEVAADQQVAEGEVLAYVPVAEPVASIEPGMQIGVGLFKNCVKVDVSGLSKGKGFQGTIKRHNFNAGDKSHGTKNVREPGSTGQHTWPSRVFPGKRMPGQMGVERSKSRALKVVEIDEVSNVMLVRGSVPGPSGGFVIVQESLKKN